jgi:hypothetical protein
MRSPVEVHQCVAPSLGGRFHERCHFTDRLLSIIVIPSHDGPNYGIYTVEIYREMIAEYEEFFGLWRLETESVFEKRSV